MIWDTYAVILLIEACEHVRNENSCKEQIVSDLTANLRRRESIFGIENKDLYKEKTEVSQQMSLMNYVLTDGREGLPGADRLFFETVELKKEKPYLYLAYKKIAEEQCNSSEYSITEKQDVQTPIHSINMEPENKGFLEKDIDVLPPKDMAKRANKDRKKEQNAEKLQRLTREIKAFLGKRKIHQLSDLYSCELGISIGSLTRLVKVVYGKTLSEYLIEENILDKSHSDHRADVEVKKRNRYSDAIEARSKNQPVHYSNKKGRQLNKQSFSYDNSPMMWNYWATRANRSRKKDLKDRLDEEIGRIRSVLGYKKILVLSDLYNLGLGVNIRELDRLTERLYGLPLYRYLINLNILDEGQYRDLIEKMDDDDVFTDINIEEKNEEETKNEGVNGKRNMTAGIEDDVALDDTDEEIGDNEDSDELIDAMELSLFRTIEYLKTRYTVELQYDYLGISDRCMQYIAKNSRKGILCVKYVYTKALKYISIETKMEYLAGERKNYQGFSRVETNERRHIQTLFYEDFACIEQTLIAICDSIDDYFKKLM